MKEKKHAGMGREFPYTNMILLLSAVLFSTVWVRDSFLLGFSAEFTGFIPYILRIILFIGLEISAIVLGFYSHNVLFSTQDREFTLITDGVFSYVRHPLYLSILLTYLGFVFASMSIVSLILRICCFIFFDKMATYEEKDLVRIFGDAYLEYRKRVSKWIPNFFLLRTK
jgi:protein-S-isoprenylcysteine O-methyltransferase Ste14